jgi:hypothetical protein
MSPPHPNPTEPVVGPCALCRKIRELRISYFMPAAMYPGNRALVLATHETTTTDPGRDDQVKDHLLCGECDQLFNRNGESEVLRWMAPKAKPGNSPLQRKVQGEQPEWWHPNENLALHTAESLGMNTEAFAYFAMSLVWRAAVYAWPLPGGRRTDRAI